MSIAHNLAVVCPPGAGVPETVADMIAAYRHTFTLPSVQESKKLKGFLSEMTTVAKRCAAALGEDPIYVPLEALVTIQDKLIAHLHKLNIDGNYAARHLNYAEKTLAYAYKLGWTCENYERLLECRHEWELVRTALRGDTDGCLSIVEHAERQLKLPCEIEEEFLGNWRQSRTGCSFETIQGYEGRFRTKMRQAGLVRMFPRLDLSIQLPGRISIPDSSMPDSLRLQIDQAVRYKTDPIVEGRPGKERVKSRTGNHIRITLRELCGLAILKGFEPTVLADVFTHDVICAFITLLRDRKTLASGIRSRLGCVRFLFKTDFVPEGDYRWFGRELRKLRNEPRWRLDERQSARSVDYEELARVPQKIRAYRMSHPELSQKDTAELVHDELFSKWPLHLPWRFCSTADCGISSPALINIIYAELTVEMRADPDLPAWVRKALALNKHQRFLQFSFGKSQCKNGHAVRDIIPIELVDLYWEYIRHHRKFLVDKHHDDGTLFLNHRGRRLSSQTCRDLYTRLVRRWINRTARAHLTRDSFCEYRLAHGDSMRQLKRKLWHRHLISTERYCRRYDTSHGVVTLHERSDRKAA